MTKERGWRFKDVERYEVHHDGITVWAVGAQRTGSHWIGWLLGDAFNSPVRGDTDWAKDFARDGLKRKGPYLVRTTNREPWCEGPMVVIVRDPRDCVASAMHYWNASFAKRWSRVKGWTKFYRRFIPLATSVVRYEDLLKDCEGELRRILDELGLEYDKSRIKGACHRQRFDAKKKWGGEGRKPADNFFWKGQSGTWRGMLTPEQIKTVEKEHGELMKELGYV